MPAKEEFDWSNDDTVVVQSQAALAVYTNAYGNVVIRQERAWDENDDPFFTISPQNVLPVVGAILREIGRDDLAQLVLAGVATGEAVGTRPADPTAAARAKAYRDRIKAEAEAEKLKRDETPGNARPATERRETAGNDAQPAPQHAGAGVTPSRSPSQTVTRDGTSGTVTERDAPRTSRDGAVTTRDANVPRRDGDTSPPPLGPSRSAAPDLLGAGR